MHWQTLDQRFLDGAKAIDKPMLRMRFFAWKGNRC
jgi:hypothetical protein